MNPENSKILKILIQALLFVYITPDIPILEPDDPFAILGKSFIMRDLDNGNSLIVQLLQSIHDHFALSRM